MMAGPIRCSRAFSLVEAVLCIALVGVALVAALRTVGASARAQAVASRQAVGTQLAADLMAEILAQAYEEPDGLTELMAERDDVPGDRSTFDDVDDFDGLSESPPRRRDNTALDGFDSWRREVAVDMVPAEDPDVDPPPVSGQTGVKRIVVRVYHGDHLAAELRALRTIAWSAGEVEGG